MFPCLHELWAVHSTLLTRLRNRQKCSPHIASIADILADTFSHPSAEKFKQAYGEFCARHRDAVEVFKECCAREPRLARFIRKCQQNPLLRKKGVPECVLFVAQRLTKYPLLLEPLLKTAGDDVGERELLQRALCGVKEVLVDVDNQVAAKEREDRKLEIYHRIDAKSFAHFRGRKFKKSDILQGNRSLKFEGVATMMQGRSKMQTLLVIVLTDVLFFLIDNNNNKYTFFTPDNKTGVVSLVSLLVREKAGAEGRGLYLICSGPSSPEMFELRVHRPKDIHAWITNVSGPSSPEMFELRVHRPKDIHAWITNVRAAVQNCPAEAEESEAGAHAISAEERQRQLEARHENITLITEALRAKDREHATILEEKMALHMKMVGHTGGSTLELTNPGVAAYPGGLVFPDYVRLAAPTLDTHALWQEVCKVVKSSVDYVRLAAPTLDTHALWQEVCKVVKDALECSSTAWGVSGGLGRSTSSAGERHSVAYESPALPRRADTFAGFDKTRHRGERHSVVYESPALPRRADTFAGFDKTRHRDRVNFYKTRHRSTSSAGERHSVAYESPALPRRADTFAGFDKTRHRGVTLRMSSETPEDQPETSSNLKPEPEADGPRLMSDQHGADAALKLQHAVYTLTCIVWQHLTTIHSLEAQLCAWRSCGTTPTPPRHDQLEELRYAQAQLTASRAAWDAQRAALQQASAHERRQLEIARAELAEQQKDVEQQRERLYRRLERLQQHGSQEELVTVGTLSPDSSISDTTKRKEPKWRSNRGSTGSESSASVARALPPPQLLSAQNETKATPRVNTISQIVKQQLPLKLASGKTAAPATNPPPYHRLHESPSDQSGGLVVSHSRTGSSPAPLPSQQPPPNNKATRTNTYPKLPDKFRVRSPEPAPPAPSEEEVIYF
ncbi:unnamed protein product [Plutella xylostella]|uniref:(diamondback moth) hypothetical protein n=1 Tax=Plutella xylostella TaxID=51655 RepID=A0A8S4G1T9_PLUXY|nr:unnamed protein product [Plutella xylostella]